MIEIEIGFRALLAVLGIVMLIAGVWHVDRAWDEDGSRAFERFKDQNDATTATSLESALDAALRPPVLFVVGWILFGASYLFPRGGGTSLDFTAGSLVAVVSALALAVVGSVPMADAVRNRKARNKMALSALFAMFWLLLSIFTSIEDDAPGAVWAFAIAGMLSIIMAMMMLWKYRKMGTSWEEDGVPNPNPVVYNLGGPMFVFGWFLFWVAAVSTKESGAGDVVLHLDWRTAVTFASGLAIVPAVFLVDHAHDEGAEFVGFGTDGSVHGRLLETPIPFIGFWVVFGFASFLSPTDSATGPIILAALAITMGLFVGLWVQKAIYLAQQDALMQRVMGFAILFVAIAATIGWAGGPHRWLVIAGTVSIIAAQMILMGDRTRGRIWMQTSEPNPHPVVYSYGVLLFPIGWILVSWAASLAFR